MKILIAADKFKGTLDAEGVCQALALGIQNVGHMPITFPMADGGDGTASILTKHHQGAWHTVKVKGPNGQTIEAGYGMSKDGKKAFIEMAAASGLSLVPISERDPMRASTVGTGMLISNAMNRGARHIILGIGGSATTDGGIGMATALGFQCLDVKGQSLPLGGGNLQHLSHIDGSEKHPLLEQTQFEVACDVDNPLFGEQGAAYIYAPQKGATKNQVAMLDMGLRQFGKVVKQSFGIEISDLPGAGAAGGLGAGAVAFLGATLNAGVALVMEHTNFEKRLDDVSLVITGEGKIDQQTLHGKLIKGICDVCQQNSKPVWAVCGSLEATTAEISQMGLSGAISIVSKYATLQDAMKNPAKYLTQIAEEIANQAT